MHASIHPQKPEGSPVSRHASDPPWGLRGFDRAVALVFFLAVLGCLRAWRYPAPFPGEGVRDFVEQVGAWPRLSPQAPLWNLLSGWLVDLGSRAGAHARLQWFGHLGLAVAAGLLYRVVLAFVLGALDEDAAPRWSAFAARVAAAGSAVFLVACPPVWRVAQSPHPAVLGLLLAVGGSLAALTYAARRSSLGALLAWAALAGFGVVESQFVLLLLPVWLFLFLLPDEAGQENGPEDPADLSSDPVLPWLLGAGVFVGAVALALLAAVLPFRGSEGFLLRGFGRTLNVLVFFARDYADGLRGALPALGWLVVLLGVLLPWLLVMGLARRVQNGEYDLGLAFLYGIAAVATTLQVAGPSRARLWSLVPGESFRAAACLLSALTFGLVVAAWWIGSERALRGMRAPAGEAPGDGTPPAAVRVGRFLGGSLGLAVGAAMLAAVAAVVPQRREARERAALVFGKGYVRQQVLDAEGCEWLVTDGLNDDELRLAAWTAGSPLQPFCLFPGQASWTRRALARRLPDDESRALLALGPQVLLRDWLARHPERVGRIAVQLGQDLWHGAPVELLPWRTVFRPAPPGAAAALEAPALLATHQEYWERLQPQLEAAQDCADPPLATRIFWARVQVARVANELGVRLEDLGRVELAIEAYRAACALNAGNLSARLNLLLAAAPDAEGGRQALEAEIRVLARAQGRARLLDLVRRDGTLRSPRALGLLGMEASLEASSADASPRLEAALRLLPESSGAARRLRAVLAGLRWRDGDATWARLAFEALLAEDPGDVAVLLGMAAVAAGTEGLAGARPWVERARQAGAAPLLCDQLLATLALESGDAEAAREVLRPYVARRVPDGTVWFLWGKAALRLNDAQGMAQARQELERLPGPRGAAALLAAQAAEQAGDLDAALDHARSALNESPGNPRLLEDMLRLCLKRNDFAAAQPVAERLLSIEPGHGVARYALGTRLLMLGMPREAEPHLARAVEEAPTVETLNNLANARLSLGRQAEARKDAEAAVRFASWLPEAWDTLAAVALAQQDHQAALEAAREAVVRAPDAASTWLRAAEVAAATGDAAELRLCLGHIERLGRQGLSENAQARLHRLLAPKAP